MNVNEMIFKTMKTKADKPAKHADELRELGYKVERYEKGANGHMWPREYWAVNGLELFKPEGCPLRLNLRTKCYEKLDRIKCIDFVGYFDKLEERREKAERMRAHDKIEQQHDYYVRHYDRWIDEDGYHFWSPRLGCTKVHRRNRTHLIRDINHVMEEYKLLKKKSEGRWSWNCRSDEDFAREDVKRAEKALADAMEQLKRARERLANAQVDMVKGDAELDAFLKMHGIRK